MKRGLLLAATGGLVFTLLPPILFFAGMMELPPVQSAMSWGMILWFVALLLLRRR
jgi:hypothetical protein